VVRMARADSDPSLVSVARCLLELGSPDEAGAHATAVRENRMRRRRVSARSIRSLSEPEESERGTGDGGGWLRPDYGLRLAGEALQNSGRSRRALEAAANWLARLAVDASSTLTKFCRRPQRPMLKRVKGVKCPARPTKQRSDCKRRSCLANFANPFKPFQID